MGRFLTLPLPLFELFDFAIICCLAKLHESVEGLQPVGLRSNRVALDLQMCHPSLRDKRGSAGCLLRIIS
jgi:hypothetical protein